jgi:glutathione peroxidase
MAIADIAGQEPGSDADVKAFCTTNYGVTFPMFSKLDVNGAGRAPLYAWLTQQATTPEVRQAIERALGS